MAKKATYPYPDKLELYHKVISNFPEIEIKGSTMPYTSSNGNMFSFMNSEGAMALRLPKDELENIITKYNTKLCVAHGVVLKEYVIIPDTLLNKTSELKKYFKLSLEYSKTLKPKTTKK